MPSLSWLSQEPTPWRHRRPTGRACYRTMKRAVRAWWPIGHALLVSLDRPKATPLPACLADLVITVHAQTSIISNSSSLSFAGLLPNGTSDGCLSKAKRPSVKRATASQPAAISALASSSVS